jgi:hypothetical protein
MHLLYLITCAEPGEAQVYFLWPPMDQIEHLKVKNTSLLCQRHC